MTPAAAAWVIPDSELLALPGFRPRDVELKDAKDLLDKHQLDALKGADDRTREAVSKALDELIAKGLVIAPGSMVPRNREPITMSAPSRMSSIIG